MVFSIHISLFISVLPKLADRGIVKKKVFSGYPHSLAFYTWKIFLDGKSGVQLM